VDDLLDGLVRLMDSTDEVTGPANFGNPGEHSMRDLASIIVQLTGSSSRIVRRQVSVPP
jgi:UDP-glucuronate decarboxylase